MIRINKKQFTREMMLALRQEVREYNRKPQSMRLMFTLTALVKYACMSGLNSFADTAYAIKLAHGQANLFSAHTEEGLRKMSVRKLVALVYDARKHGLQELYVWLNARFAPQAQMVVLADYQSMKAA